MRSHSSAVVFIVMLVTAMFMVSLAAPAFSEMRVPTTTSENAVQGKIVSIQNSHDLTVLTVRPSGNKGDVMHIFVGPYEKVISCQHKEFAKDITVGNTATVKYHELAGLAIGDRITKRC